jgi:hypothetical protein
VAADGEEAEAAALRLESVQQMRELLRQAKIMLRQASGYGALGSNSRVS